MVISRVGWGGWCINVLDEYVTYITQHVAVEAVAHAVVWSSGGWTNVHAA